MAIEMEFPAKSSGAPDESAVNPERVASPLHRADARKAASRPLGCRSCRTLDPLPTVPNTAADVELIEFVNGWASLLEKEDFEAAFRYTAHVPEMNWNSQLICEVIRSYGDANPGQKVTVEGKSTDISQRKTVRRWPRNQFGVIGEIWYDLNIDGYASDLTATFDIEAAEKGLTIRLNDIHVM